MAKWVMGAVQAAADVWTPGAGADSRFDESMGKCGWLEDDSCPVV